MTSSIADPVASVPRSLYIGGEWRESSTDRTFPVENPATGEVLAQVADASPEDARAAMDAACRAADGWAMCAVERPMAAGMRTSCRSPYGCGRARRDQPSSPGGWRLV